MRIAGGLVAYASLAAFVGLLGLQTYRWLREGEWPHIGIGEGLRALLGFYGVDDGGVGRLARLARWLDTPTDWLGWHRVLEAIPASIGLFLISVCGNFVQVYGSDLRDRMDEASET